MPAEIRHERLNAPVDGPAAFVAVHRVHGTVLTDLEAGTVLTFDSAEYGAWWLEAHDAAESYLLLPVAPPPESDRAAWEAHDGGGYL